MHVLFAQSVAHDAQEDQLNTYWFEFGKYYLVFEGSTAESC